ncbi:MAG: S-layer homology domain-containing protein [Clostridiales bacterium]|nr:S-layer homology domain-containing protein [Clostridiales bacterium]
MKRLYSVLIICIILLCTSFYNPHVNANSSRDFIDVSDNYWGKDFIDFASEIGIIAGYPVDGDRYKFMPEANVTKEESLQMIYKAVTNSGLRKTYDIGSKYEDLLASNMIGEWAWECVSFGLEFDIINKDELAGFRDDFGRSMPASREEVARWTARAIDRKLMPATSLDYIDKDNISKENLVYVDLLHRMSIMIGDNLGKFNAKDSIRRVEFAVICTRVYDLAESPYNIDAENRSYQGVITGIDKESGKIFLKQLDGSVRLIDYEKNAQFIIDGVTEYNIDKIPRDSNLIIAWGPYNQIHINTEVMLAEARVQNINSLDSSCSELALRLPDGNIVYYFTDRETFFINEIKKNDDIIFIADGIIIIEILNQ